MFKLATKINSLIHYTKGTLLLLKYFKKLQLLVSIKFQYYFKFTLINSIFTFPSRYFYTINHQNLLDLRVGPQSSNNTRLVSFYFTQFFIFLQGYHINVTFYGFIKIQKTMKNCLVFYRVRSPLLTVSRLIF